MMAVTDAFTAVGPGVINPHAIMHSAGPAKAIPYTKQKTVASIMMFGSRSTYAALSVRWQWYEFSGE